ncbi:MAG: phospholipid carrier-dependent glycosyltransferase [Planctomycetaceae bacterium]|jgi:hypothetical protein|nr:phospholipid carrier-dependent glycosyltransferase [Planctomycetaceae bacterium]
MKYYRSWFFLFFVALLLRLGAAGYWEYRNGSEEFYFGDSDTYWKLGQAIAAGQPYRYGDHAIHRMPGYPLLLSPLFLVSGHQPPIFAARIENVIFGSLTVLAVAWLAWILFHNGTLALMAGWITAIDPLNIVMSVLVLSEAPFCLFLVLHLVFWIKAFQASPKTNWFSLFAAGLFSAAAIYCRPSWLYFVPFAVGLGMMLSPKNYKPILKSGAVIFAVCTLCLLPWWIRNYYVSGHFVSTTLQAGPSLYDGLNPKATGASDMKFVEDFRNAEFNLSPNIAPQTLEYRLNQKMRQAAINWAWKHPDLAWKLARTKFFRLWNFFPNEAAFSDFVVKAVVFCTYFPVLVLGIFGVVRSLFHDFSVRLLWIPAIYITGLHVIFVSSIRYRAPAMICFSILAAWVVFGVVQKKN